MNIDDYLDDIFKEIKSFEDFDKFKNLYKNSYAFKDVCLATGITIDELFDFLEKLVYKYVLNNEKISLSLFTEEFENYVFDKMVLQLQKNGILEKVWNVEKNGFDYIKINDYLD